MKKLINRKNYIQQLDKLKDEHIIKVVTAPPHNFLQQTETYKQQVHPAF